MERKGFPESYDLPALLSFLSDIKAGSKKVTAPVYSHLVYDIVLRRSGSRSTAPDILIVEGLNVLQAPRLPRDGKAVPFVSDFFDFSIYIDADEADIHRWYVARFQRLRETAFRDPTPISSAMPRSARPRRSRSPSGSGRGSISSICATTSCRPGRAPI